MLGFGTSTCCEIHGFVNQHRRDFEINHGFSHSWQYPCWLCANSCSIERDRLVTRLLAIDL
jgi:hypothetical protein